MVLVDVRTGIRRVQLSLCSSSLVKRLSPSACAVGDHELAIVQLLLIALIRIVDLSVHRRGDKLLKRSRSSSEHERRLSSRVHQGDDGAQGKDRAST